MATINYEYNSNFIPGQYFPSFDPTGLKPENKVISEIHVISQSQDNFHVLVPLFGPFFSDGFVITFKRSSTNDYVILREGVDYMLVYQFIGATRACAKPLYGGISLLNKELDGRASVTYQSLGGSWIINQNKINEVLSNQLQNPRITSWEQIVSVPNVFPVIEHEWDLKDLVGASEVVESIDKISLAISTAPANETDTDALRLILDSEILRLSANLDTYFARTIESVSTTDLLVIRNKFDIENVKDSNNVLLDRVNKLSNDLLYISQKSNKDYGQQIEKIESEIEIIRSEINALSNNTDLFAARALESIAGLKTNEVRKVLNEDY